MSVVTSDCIVAARQPVLILTQDILTVFKLVSTVTVSTDTNYKLNIDKIETKCYFIYPLSAAAVIRADSAGRPLGISIFNLAGNIDQLARDQPPVILIQQVQQQHSVRSKIVALLF